MNAPSKDENKADEGEDFDEDFDDIEADEKDAGKEKKADAPPAAKGAKPAEKDKSDDDDLGDFDEDFEEDEPVDDLEDAKTKDKAAQPKAAADTAHEPHAPKKAVPLQEIPLCVVLEVGRIQMSIKKLLELQPGNMLEVDIHPEAGVDMVVNGKKVARGELLKIGDAIGVRISERL